MDTANAGPRPALVVVLDPPGALAPPERVPRLVDTLPAARAVLEIGAVDALRDAYLERHPDASWIRADADRLGTAPAGAFGLLVLSADPARWVDPVASLARLRALAAPDAMLVACADNAASWPTLARLVEGDLGPVLAGSATAGASPVGLAKWLLDAGWMPDLVAEQPIEAPPPALAAAIDALADACAVPRTTAARTMRTAAAVLGCRPLKDASIDEEAAVAGRTEAFAVVVPTTRETQLRLNVEASPGLREAGATIVSCQRANDPADALARALPHVEAPWVLLAHQDVYFPSGFGRRLAALLAAVPDAERSTTLIGFAGMAVAADGASIAPSGFVIDRLRRFDHPASTRAVSIDEFAVVVARDTRLRIDPSLGWHLWATDLCLDAMTEHRRFARIVRLPVFHNSSNDWTLPRAFAESARRLAAKRAGYGPIHTLCGTIDASARQDAHA